jgi:hypothetical protein
MPIRENATPELAWKTWKTDRLLKAFSCLLNIKELAAPAENIIFNSISLHCLPYIYLHRLFQLEAEHYCSIIYPPSPPWIPPVLSVSRYVSIQMLFINPTHSISRAPSTQAYPKAKKS